MSQSWKSMIQKKVAAAVTKKPAATDTKNTAATTTTAAKNVAPTTPNAQTDKSGLVRRASTLVLKNVQTNKKEDLHRLKSLEIAYIFFAEFDIDKGSVIRLQYPRSYKEIAAQMLPDGAHNIEEDTNIFFLRKKELKKGVLEEEDNMTALKTDQHESTSSNTIEHVDADMYYCLNVIKQKKIQGIRRKARVKSLAVASKQPFALMLKPFLLHALDKIFDYDTELLQQTEAGKQDIVINLPKPNEIIKALYDLISAKHVIDLPLYHVPERVVLRWCNKDVEKRTQNVKFPTFMEKDISIPFPTAMLDNEMPDGRISVIRVLDNLQEHTMVLLNAILFEKKILFSGYNVPAGDVSSFVLGTACLFPMGSLVRDRIYPYTSFDDLSFLKHPGYIVGVCNPMFKSRNDWFDVIVDLTDFKVTVKDSVSGQAVPAGEYHFKEEEFSLQPTKRDHLFIQKVLKMIRTWQEKHPEAKENPELEDAVRGMFRDYFQDMIDVAMQLVPIQDFMNTEQVLFKQSKKRKLSVNNNSPASPKVEGRSKSIIHFKSLSEDPNEPPEEVIPKDEKSLKKSKLRKYTNYYKAMQWRTLPSFQQLRVKYHDWVTSDQNVYRDVLKLRYSPVLNETELIGIYQKFTKHIQTRAQIVEFLSLFPETREGLYAVLASLFHPSQTLRTWVVNFVQRLEETEEGKNMVKRANPFIMSTYQHNKHLGSQQLSV